MYKIVLTEEIENQIKDLNENQCLHKMKNNQLCNILNNELIFDFEIDFDCIVFIYKALDCIYYDCYFNSIDYDLNSIKRIAASFAFDLIDEFYFQLKDLITKLEEVQESLDTKLSRISRNKLNQYIKDDEEREYVDDLIGILRFALYSLFGELIDIIRLKTLQHDFEEQLISDDDLNE